jgi:ketosteroid isomerase-like protein
MSTAANATDTAALDQDLNNRILTGDILAAFDLYYDDNVTMQENTDTPITGKAANRKREEDFVASIEQFHGAKLVGSAVNGDRSYSEWEWDVTFKGGHRALMSQVAARKWANGKVVQERFYYNKG